MTSNRAQKSGFAAEAQRKVSQQLIKKKTQNNNQDIYREFKANNTFCNLPYQTKRKITPFA